MIYLGLIGLVLLYIVCKSLESDIDSRAEIIYSEMED
jgi:hypothetical protein